MRKSVLFAIAALSPSVLSSQPSAPFPVAAPLRDLKWGQLNFLHTTDTHGWLAGHLQEPSFSADWGDYISFATRMREKAEADGTDLLVIDSGDRVEGNGLYDASDPKGVYTSEILKQQHIDILCSGNHELYQQNTSENEFLMTVPNFKGNYLASNINITDPRTGDSVPLAQRFKKFTTKKQGIRVVAFGLLFDFTGNGKNTAVQPVEETIKEQWFRDAIMDREVDLFLVVGHVPVHSREYNAVFQAIRSEHWDTPIQFFGGHYHIRDFAKYDSNAYGLASGRFMETIGFMSIDGLSSKKQPSDPQIASTVTFNRRYIDNNLYSFHHHSGLNDTNFPTPQGKQVSHMIGEARHALNLDQVYGCSPQNYWMSRAQYPSNDSIYTWIEQQVLPNTLYNASRADKPGYVILNTGAIRFDIFEGRFTQDTAYILSPFISEFRYIKDVPYPKATKILEVLNKQTKILAESSTQKLDSASLAPCAQVAKPQQVIVDPGQGEEWPYSYENSEQIHLSDPLVAKQKLIPGYTTKDDVGSDGDDTVHSPMSFYLVPNCIAVDLPTSNSSTAATPPTANSDDIPETIDLIYIDFIEPWINVAAKFVGLDLDIEKDVEPYMLGSKLSDLIVRYVQKHWNCEHDVHAPN